LAINILKRNQREGNCAPNKFLNHLLAPRDLLKAAPSSKQNSHANKQRSSAEAPAASREIERKGRAQNIVIIIAESACNSYFNL